MSVSAIALPYVYAYGINSSLIDDDRWKRLYLAMSAESEASDFFRGRALAPKRLADGLLAVSDVVASRFHMPGAMLKKILLLADPVITCGGDRLRFEGFSACCGAYARLDVLPEAVDGAFIGRGTSNVDFNAPMRGALATLRDGDDVSLSLRADAFALRSGEHEIIERKVDLPLRWVRGFSEVQAYQARMRRRFSVDGPAFRRFIRSLPVRWKGVAWVSALGADLRVGAQRGSDSVCVGGITRLRALQSMAAHAVSVNVYTANDDGATAWEIVSPDSRFVLVLSPDVWRGFSGEGQTLESFADASNATAAHAVRGALRWQSVIDVATIAAQASLPVTAVQNALAECAASGLVGFDLFEGAYFHRKLPFDASSARAAQPRMRGAEKLLAETAVEITRDDEAIEAWVRSGTVEYRVTIADGASRCTCPWFAKHRDTRGPCKHVVATTMMLART